MNLNKIIELAAEANCPSDKIAEKVKRRIFADCDEENKLFMTYFKVNEIFQRAFSVLENYRTVF